MNMSDTTPDTEDVMRRFQFLALSITAVFGLSQAAVAQDWRSTVPDGHRAVVGTHTNGTFHVAANAPVLKPGAPLPNPKANTPVRIIPCGEWMFEDTISVLTADGKTAKIVFLGSITINCQNVKMVRSVARDTLTTLLVDPVEFYRLRNGRINAAAWHATAKANSTELAVQQPWIEHAMHDAAEATPGVKGVTIQSVTLQ